jgi:hypothetical protein
VARLKLKPLGRTRTVTLLRDKAMTEAVLERLKAIARRLMEEGWQ